MATYKVLQDIEAEDKLVGPLTLWQFIYAAIAGLAIYLSVMAVVKNVSFFLAILVPVIMVAGFLAVPWGGDQPTEVWALAKLRYFLKPRKRIWSQDGMTELVTVTAPKTVERALTDGLSQHEVRSRLSALANTLDSRGWVVKNININMSTQTQPSYTASDRLVDVSGQPTPVNELDVRADDDILDMASPVAQKFTNLINTASAEYHKTLIERMNQPTEHSNLSTPPQAAPQQPINTAQPVFTPPTQVQSPTTQSTSTGLGDWFTPKTTTPPPIDPDDPVVQTGAPQANTASVSPQAATPTAEEQEFMRRIAEQNLNSTAATNNLKIIKTPDQLIEEARIAAEQQRIADEKARLSAVEAEAEAKRKATIANLAGRSDFDIATIQRQADKTLKEDEGEVVISLH